MKRTLAFLCAAMLFVSAMVTMVVAVDWDHNPCAITSEELSIIKSNMETRNLWGDNFTAEHIYNSDDNPKFLLGVTSKGYIILEQGTYRFHEAGQKNPYANYMQAKKYYGGPLYYYADATNMQLQTALNAGTVYDILRDRNENVIAKTIFNDKEIVFQDKTSVPKTLNSKAAVNSTYTRVANSYSYIRSRAFGYNDDNTCSAVAVGIALNYLSLQHNMAFVPSSWESETLIALPGNPSDLASDYPHAYTLHRYLVDDCGMGAVSYADGIKTPLETYISAKVPSSYDFSLSWTLLPRAATIKSNIDDDKPVLITTTIAGDYSTHTMVAYGYRDIDSTELLIHTGWYDEDHNDYYEVSGTKHYYQIETWISESYATYGYYFSFN